MKRLPLRHARLLVAGAACSLAVTGCGVDQLAEEGAEKAVEEAVEQGASGDVDIDVDGEGGVKVESSDGAFEVGSQEMPEDFPADTVPVIDGSLLNSTRIEEGEDTTWSVSFQTEAAPGDSFAEALASLESAGFESSQTTESATYSNAVMRGHDLGVLLTATEISSEEGSTISYTVSTAPQ